MTQFTPAQIDCILDIYGIVVTTNASTDRFRQLLEDVVINDPDADAAIAAEREACALLAEQQANSAYGSAFISWRDCAIVIRNDIRART